jgi:5'(3')-deoxyribonucleotidase
MILHKGFTKLKVLPFSKILIYLEEKRKSENIEVNILGSYGRKDNTSLIIDKNEWLVDNVPFIFDGVYLVAGKHKKKIFADKDSILIDDTKQNIDDFVFKGGFGILHENQEDTLNKLKSYFDKI